MPLATTQGKQYALEQLAKRRERAKTEKKIDNGSLPAYAPMYFDCKACGCQDIKVPENYISRPQICDECQALKDLGWLE